MTNPARTLPSYVVRDPRALAAALAERQLPGQRSMTAITRLRRTRERLRTGLPDLRDWAADARARRATEQGARDIAQPAVRPELAARAARRILARYAAEITRRGGETAIYARDSRQDLRITDRHRGLALLHADGWRWYGGREQMHRRAALSYLCGTDDSGPWAVRVPGDLTRVTAAEHWVTPARVLEAASHGRRVRRQGDIYAIEAPRRHDTPTGWVGGDWRTDPATGQPVTSHWWNAETRYLVHRPAAGGRHRPVRLPWPVQFCQQRTLTMGRAGGRQPGD
jgi:hypothetical protein